MTQLEFLISFAKLLIGMGATVIALIWALALVRQHRVGRINREHAELFRSVGMHWSKDPQVPYPGCGCKVCTAAAQSKEKRP